MYAGKIINLWCVRSGVTGTLGAVGGGRDGGRSQGVGETVIRQSREGLTL